MNFEELKMQQQTLTTEQLKQKLANSPSLWDEERRAIEAILTERAALQEATDSELLDWLESQVHQCLGGCPWYQAMGEVHLRRVSLREALRAARQAEVAQC